MSSMALLPPSLMMAWSSSEGRTYKGSGIGRNSFGCFCISTSSHLFWHCGMWMDKLQEKTETSNRFRYQNKIHAPSKERIISNFVRGYSGHGRDFSLDNVLYSNKDLQTKTCCRLYDATFPSLQIFIIIFESFLTPLPVTSDIRSMTMQQIIFEKACAEGNIVRNYIMSKLPFGSVLPATKVADEHTRAWPDSVGKRNIHPYKIFLTS